MCVCAVFEISQCVGMAVRAWPFWVEGLGWSLWQCHGDTNYLYFKLAISAKLACLLASDCFFDGYCEEWHVQKLFEAPGLELSFVSHCFRSYFVSYTFFYVKLIICPITHIFSSVSPFSHVNVLRSSLFTPLLLLSAFWVYAHLWIPRLLPFRQLARFQLVKSRPWPSSHSLNQSPASDGSS